MYNPFVLYSTALKAVTKMTVYLLTPNNKANSVNLMYSDMLFITSDWWNYSALTEYCKTNAWKSWTMTDCIY